MRQIFTLLLACIAINGNLKGQPSTKNSTNISMGLDMLFPSSDFANRYNLGGGTSVKVEYVFAKHISAVASLGYARLPGSDVPDFQLLPALGGFRYYVGNFYIGAEAGYGFALREGDDNGMLYVLSVGNEIITSRRSGNSLDVSVRIQQWNVQSNVLIYGLRLAYEFRLSKASK